MISIARKVYILRRMPWWVWILAGLALLVAETVLPADFFLFFVGLSALVVGTLTGLEVAGPAWTQWLLFSGVTIASMLLLRGPLLTRLRAAKGSDDGIESLIGEIAVLMEDLRPGQVGKAELRGTVWTVRSGQDLLMESGQRCRVDRVDGLVLWVSPEAKS